MRFNQVAGPLRYKRTVLSARDGKGRLLGGIIIQSYWRETYIELLWLSAHARRSGVGAKQGYRRFGTISGSPRGERRHFYVKKLR